MYCYENNYSNSLLNNLIILKHFSTIPRLNVFEFSENNDDVDNKTKNNYEDLKAILFDQQQLFLYVFHYSIMINL